MAIHVRRKKHTTPRFKPDMWGRTPVPQGVVLYDGAVTITDGNPVPIELDAPFVLGATVAITLNDVELSGEVAEEAEGVIGVIISLQADTLTIVTVEGTGSFFQAGGEPAVLGENSLKIVQYES